MTTTVLAPLLRSAFLNNNGQPLAGGQLFSYQAGTVTPLATYTDSTGLTQNANPTILNARGEASVWIPPNIAYKFVLQDSFGTQIWSVDQVNNSQLVTLYGGVDTGIANAYVLNFTANFSAYQDGIVLYWFPSHTNTGASTINVNGLGVVNITNQDGSAIGSGTLIANQSATILYKGGSFLLISTGNTALSSTFTGTLTGTASGTVKYFIVGRMCILQCAITGPSVSTSLVMTGLPAACTPTSGAALIPCMLEDNGSNLGGWAQINSGTGNIVFGTGFNNNQSGFTASGTKGLPAGWTITYPIN